MATSSVLNTYLNKKSAMDVWEETKHHRADNGQFTSGSGRGKSKEDNDKGKGKKDGDDDKGREEMSEERATRIVRSAFEKAKCELKGLKLVEHHLNASVKEADTGSLDKINEYLTERGLKAKIQDKTTYKIAEDGYDDIQVVDDPMLEVLVDLCRIELLAKDLHYRANGRSFYGIHLLSDLVHDIGGVADDLNEVYYMGEKGEEPPERAYVASKAAEMVGKAGDETAILNALYGACDEVVKAVENAKKGGVASGTAAVLDDISKKALQSKALLAKTIKDVSKSNANASVIDDVVGKGFYIQPEAAATQDSGTHEGAVKAAQTRKSHSGLKVGDRVEVRGKGLASNGWVGSVSAIDPKAKQWGVSVSFPAGKYSNNSGQYSHEELYHTHE